MLPSDQNDPFAQFKATFFEECAELLADMEANLGDLESMGGDNELLNAIFRAIHSIKAGAGAFNFTRLVSFTHSFETLLDEMREGRIAVTDDLIPVVFQGFDVMSDLVGFARDGAAVAEDFGADTLATINSILEGGGASAPTDVAPQPEPEAAPSSTGRADVEVRSAEGGDATRRVVQLEFKPKSDMFRHANEPLLIIRELAGLGELKVEADTESLPALEDMEPEDAYLSWNFLLETEESRDEIDEVFEFVLDDCELTVIDHDKGGKVASVAAFPLLPEAQSYGIYEKQRAAELAAQSGNVPAADALSGGGSAATPAVKPAAGGAPAAKTASKVASIRVDIDRVDRLVNMVGELVITQSMLGQELENTSTAQNARLMSGMEVMSTHIRELQDNVMAIRMQPVKSVFQRMPRIVRDVSGKLGKKVRLDMVGEATEVDKTVIEELADPLTHMIRNSLDHGLEMPEERVAAGKPEEGQIRLSAEHRGGRIIIEISDDGRGVNRDRVFEKAVEKGVIEPGAPLSAEEIDNLIFAPGFSTAEEVTDLSGRGVGMDVVRRNIQALGGRVSVTSTPGKGTRFQLTLPLTLAVLDGMVVGVGDEHYVVPINNIIETVRPDASDVYDMVGGDQVMRIRGNYVHLVSVAEVFAVANAERNPSKGLVVLTEADGGRIVGLVVDHLVGQQQVVIKSLEQNYEAVPGIASATILGDGSVCLILDVDRLAQMPSESKDTEQNTDLPSDPLLITQDRFEEQAAE